MKTIHQLSLFVFFLFVIIVVPSCGGNKNEESEKVTSEITDENLVIADYSIEGMVCSMGCAATIQKELMDMEGVANCEVDFEAGKAHVEYDKSILSEGDVISKIESIADGQYKVSKWKDKGESNVNVEQNSNGENKDVVEDEAKAKVALPSFQIPNLFTFLINQL
ncbi:MAG: hypothetical protein A3K10_10925 [Bacteroidetes bacterium RIFCSPLOWO2_12_FULL_31_6]|nr:MAG: hypothetical protein A3K10_10925 [Bacteroidetes bacterium RIFCSPLOWO2_12_FULL_31_6]